MNNDLIILKKYGLITIDETSFISIPDYNKQFVEKLRNKINAEIYNNELEDNQEIVYCPVCNSICQKLEHRNGAGLYDGGYVQCANPECDYKKEC